MKKAILALFVSLLACLGAAQRVTPLSRDAADLRYLLGTAAGRYASANQPVPPTGANGSAQGYSVGSVWQAGGRLWSMVYDGVWAELPAAPLVGDVLGTNWTGGGMVAWKSGYTGAGIDVRTTVSGSPVTTTINILASGELDNATLRATIAKADSGTLTYLVKIYDQSGNGKHAVVTASYDPLIVDWDDELGRFTYSSAYSPNPTTGNSRALQIDTTLATTGNNFGLFTFGRCVGSADKGTLMFGSLGNYTGGGSTMLAFQSDTTGNLQKWSTAQSSRYPSTPVVPECGPCVMGLVSNSTNTTYFVNERTGVNSTTPTAESYSGGWIGTDRVQGRVAGMRYLGFAVATTAPTTAQVAAIKRGAYVLMDVRPQSMFQVAAFGDSRVAGTGTDYTGTLGSQLAAALGRSARVYSLGNGSQTAQAMLTAQIATVAPLRLPGAQNVAFLLAGINDYIVNGSTVSATVGYLQADAALLKSNGWTVVMVTGLSANNSGNATFEAGLRSSILSNGAAGMNSDRILDLSTFGASSQVANTAIYGDGLHPTTPFALMIASAMAGIARLLQP